MITSTHPKNGACIIHKESFVLSQRLVSVVIVNWNGKHLLAECLDSVRDQQVSDLEIILVDNGSKDGSVQFVRGNYPDVVLVALEENRGFAGGNNEGIRRAKGRYIALLNNDTKVDHNWLRNLLESAELSKPSVGMWASKILSYHSPGVLDNVGLLLYPDGLGRGKGRLEADHGQYDGPAEAFFPSGCAALFRREVLDDTGLFDEEFFAYADDVDLGLRARLCGWSCRYVPSARVYHKYSASSSAYSPFKAFLVERNRILVLLRNFPVELILCSPLFTAVRFLAHFYAAVAGRGASGKFSQQESLFKAIGIVMQAWVAAIRMMPGVIRKRASDSRKRRISRTEFYRLLCRFRLSIREVALKE